MVKMQSFMPSKFIIAVHTLAFFVVFIPINKVSSAGLVEKTCKETPYYDLCVTTLSSDPESSKADVKGLARIAARKLLNEGLGTLGQIYQMFKDAKDEELKKALQVCLKAYSMITSVDMMQTLEGITKGNLKYSLDGASDVPNQTDMCEKSFTKSPFTSKNEAVHDLSVVVASMIKTLM